MGTIIGERCSKWCPQKATVILGDPPYNRWLHARCEDCARAEEKEGWVRVETERETDG